MDDYEKKITETTKEACALISEKLPDSKYVVAIFGGNEDEENIWHTFKGHMDIETLLSLACGTIDTIAGSVGMTRKQIIRILAKNEDPITNMEELK